MKITCNGPPWEKISRGKVEIFKAGQFDFIDSIDNLFSTSPSITPEHLTEAIQQVMESQNACFGLIVETPELIFAVTDQVRSYPIFLQTSEDSVESISTAVDQGATPNSRVCETSIREFLLCGYVLSDRTVFDNVRILDPGRIFIYDKEENKSTDVQLYQYLPQGVAQHKREELIEEFNYILDQIFKEIIKKYGNQEIWIPLSGGLDSRLVLTKLLEHGHDGLTTFSFGVRQNHEIRRARAVAKALGVRWVNLASDLNNLPLLKNSDSARQYSHLSFSAQTAPIWLDFEAINRLVSEGQIPNTARIINGYSGDFLFGGHIPHPLFQDPTLDTLCSCIISKHCSHFLSPFFQETTERIRQNIRDDFTSIFGQEVNVETLSSYYEHWDWKERQVKAVVAGQRTYDFFRLDWSLPFWDRRLMEFWSRVPINLKLDQDVHIQFLKHYNFRYSFDKLRSPNELWTPILKWVPIAGFMLQTLSNSRIKQNFYDAMYFYGYYRFQLGLFGHSTFRRTTPYLRKPYVVPISAYTYLMENGFPLPSDQMLFQHPQISE